MLTCRRMVRRLTVMLMLTSSRKTPSGNIIPGTIVGTTLLPSASDWRAIDSATICKAPLRIPMR